MHSLKVAVIDAANFEGDHTFDRFCRTLHRRLHLLEPLRYQLVDIPFKAAPSDVAGELQNRPRLPRPVGPGGEPGGRRELDEVVGEIASTRPLWEFQFVEGMANGRFAVVGKVHHALADGIASGNMMARAMDLRGSVQDERDRYVTDVPPSKGELLREAGRDHLHQIARLPRLVKHTCPRYRRRATAPPRRTRT